jgi:hypothetical protein
MPVATVQFINDLVTKHKAEPKVYLGSYMPFAGVKYYGLFDEEDVAEGRTHIGAVGWRRAESASAESREPVAA